MNEQSFFNKIKNIFATKIDLESITSIFKSHSHGNLTNDGKSPEDTENPATSYLNGNGNWIDLSTNYAAITHSHGNIDPDGKNIDTEHRSSNLYLGANGSYSDPLFISGPYDNDSSTGTKIDMNNYFIGLPGSVFQVLVYNSSSGYSTYHAPEAGWILYKTYICTTSGGVFVIQLAYSATTGNAFIRKRGIPSTQTGDYWSAWKSMVNV